jgi:hydrogenase maturation protease
MDPVAVLSGLQALGGRLPSTLVVGCQPAAVEEGIGLSPEVTAAVEVAVTRVRALVGELVSGLAGELAAAAGEVS